MKKQLIAIGLASVLTAPSVALADATIYGSFRTGLEFQSGEGASDATVTDFGSRFGLKGSSEVSEGLTASFKLEQKFDTAAANLSGGRIGMVGLAGGFGSIGLGQMWTASANHFYFALDPTFNYGAGGGAHFRAARMVSYSSSVGAVSFQIDRHTDANDAATIEFGASTSAGPVSVGFGYWSKEDSKSKANITDTVRVVAGKAENNGVIPLKLVNESYELVPSDNEVKYEIEVDTETVTETKHPKTSFTGFVVSSSLAGMNMAIGVGSTDHGIDDAESTADVDESQTDVSIVALSGSIGDSGVSFAAQMSNSDKTAAGDPSTSVVNLTSSLGGGASLIFEHVSRKGKLKDASLVALKVDF